MNIKIVKLINMLADCDLDVTCTQVERCAFGNVTKKFELGMYQRGQRLDALESDTEDHVISSLIEILANERVN